MHEMQNMWEKNTLQLQLLLHYSVDKLSMNMLKNEMPNKLRLYNLQYVHENKKYLQLSDCVSEFVQ